MTEPRWTLDNFRRAGRGHLDGASRILEDLPAGGTHPALTPSSAAYLAHVALECAIKARLLSRGGYASTEELAKKAPQVFASLFRTARGHHLDALADYLRLKSFVETCGKTWSADDCWCERRSSWSSSGDVIGPPA